MLLAVAAGMQPPPVQVASVTDAPLAGLAGLFVNQAQRKQQRADIQAADQARCRALFDTPSPFGRA